MSLADVLADIARRDERDRSRAIAPLVPARDARVLDTTTLDIERGCAHCRRQSTLCRSRASLTVCHEFGMREIAAVRLGCARRSADSLRANKISRGGRAWADGGARNFPF